ncbi:MAG: cupin domain-containing protein [bacterium]|nr:cupin domain-containing protein [bacterium]
MSYRLKFLTMALALVLMVSGSVARAHSSEEVSEAEITKIVQSFAEDYTNDPMAIDGTFGIHLNDYWWTITVKRAQESYAPNKSLTFHRFGPHDVDVRNGMPEKPTWYFRIESLHVLNLIASGQVNAGTAAMQSFGSDQVGVEIETMDGFEMDAGAEADMYLALSHFWTKGRPEITIFGRDESLSTHGASAVSLHTMKGYRIAWFSIGPDETANDDPLLEEGQVPNLFIVTSGRGRAILADQEVEIEAGMSIFIPQYTKHVISNPYDQPLEGILVLYGDNSDFAFGTSYQDYLEDLNAFHGDYPFRR